MTPKMEAITFGAGDISICHCPDERQPLDQLEGGHGDDDGRDRPARGRVAGPPMSTRIGVDVGGTFTDLIAYDAATGIR